jgi:serine/threonine protein kinase
MSNDSVSDDHTVLPNPAGGRASPITPSPSVFDSPSIGDQHTSLPNAARTPSAAPGTSIAGRYELIRQLGRGGMGEVHLCRDTRLNREVALKRLLSDRGIHAVALERFRREATAIAQLSHPNIVHLYDFGDDASGPYMVMELLSGSDLQVWVREHGKLASSEVLRIARQICQGLAYAHARGVVHRDLKPSNLFRLPDGSIKLLDFGLARDNDNTQMSMRGFGIGTPDYAAPEQREDASKADARSDLYSLGATLYYLATGKSPKVVRERELPNELRTLVLGLMEDQPSARPQTIQAAVEAIGAAERSTGSAAEESDVEHDRSLDLDGSVDSAAHSRRSASHQNHEHAIFSQSVQSWADVLVGVPDPNVIKDQGIRDRIAATTLPWRVRDRVTGVEMVLIPPGKFHRQRMLWISNEISITKAFYLGVYEVTQGEWVKQMGSNPSEDRGDLRRPVTKVSWSDALGFCEKSQGLRLPTEAEWELACRADSTSPRYGVVDAIAWHSANAQGGTHPVGLKQPNGFGLHDMLGNVWEWCSDRYHIEHGIGLLSGAKQNDPVGPNFGEQRSVRGSSCALGAGWCVATSRHGFPPKQRAGGVGFRVARNP